MTTLEFLRQFRLGGYAVFDFAVSFLGMFLLSPLLSKLFLKLHLEIPKLNWVFLTIPIAIIVHLLVGNMTPMTKSLLDLHGGYITKLIALASLILGIYGIKII
jgi:hypothetical protein